MVAKQPQYSPKQVSEALHASESSIKRWCDSGVIPTVRTAGGHRRITLDGLQEYLRTSGRSLADPRVLGLPALSPVRDSVLPGDPAQDYTDFRRALTAGDVGACREIIRARRASGIPRFEAIEELVTDAMRGIGEAWSCSQIDPYQERRACGICVRLINESIAELPMPEPDALCRVGRFTLG